MNSAAAVAGAGMTVELSLPPFKEILADTASSMVFHVASDVIRCFRFGSNAVAIECALVSSKYLPKG